MKSSELLTLAKKARESSYSPYSNFSVGAALLTRDGRVFLGCNIENASFTPTCCAERVAIFKAISAGVRDFEAIAVVGARDGREAPLCSPCGVCRQVLSEFCDESFRVILADGEDAPVELTMGELLPRRFTLNESEETV